MNVIEGYDILAMGFAASGLAAEWGISAPAVGLLISAGLMGMAAGSTVVAPIADRTGNGWCDVGRRGLTKRRRQHPWLRELPTRVGQDGMVE